MRWVLCIFAGAAWAQAASLPASVRQGGVIRVLGPAAAPIVKLKSDYRYHFVLKSASREKLHNTLRAMLDHALQQKIPRTNVIVDVDALWLM